jgi:hypothetical protein
VPRQERPLQGHSRIYLVIIFTFGLIVCDLHEKVNLSESACCCAAYSPARLLAYLPSASGWGKTRFRNGGIVCLSRRDSSFPFGTSCIVPSWCHRYSGVVVSSVPT